jgi:hypothetical protein
MYKQLWLVLLLLCFAFAGGCAKINTRTSAIPAPIFQNGDIVRCTTSENEMVGIISQCNYQYVPNLNTWYCAVDFCPASITGQNFSRFNECHREYIYEYELRRESAETAQKIRQNQIPPRWDWMYRD